MGCQPSFLVKIGQGRKDIRLKMGDLELVFAKFCSHLSKIISRKEIHRDFQIFFKSMGYLPVVYEMGNRFIKNFSNRAELNPKPRESRSRGEIGYCYPVGASFISSTSPT